MAGSGRRWSAVRFSLSARTYLSRARSPDLDTRQLRVGGLLRRSGFRLWTTFERVGEFGLLRFGVVEQVLHRGLDAAGYRLLNFGPGSAETGPAQQMRKSSACPRDIGRVGLRRFALRLL